MKKIKFKELFEYQTKSTYNTNDSIEFGDYPFFTSSNEVKKRTDKPIYFEEAIIIGDGGTANINYCDTPFATNSHCYVFYSKKVNLKYVYYFLKSNIHLIQKGFKGAGIKNISKRYIENIEIDVPNGEEQNRIVTILDKVELLLFKRRETIQALDNILLSYYHTLFGSKNNDYKSWRTIELQEYRKDKKGSMRTGPFGSSLTHDKFIENGDIAVLGIDNVVENIFRYNKNRYVSEEEYKNLKSYTVYGRDVVISIMGTVGRSAVVPEDIGVAINTKHLVAITLDESKCNPYYLSYSFHSNSYIKQQLVARSRGAIMDGLNLGIIKQIKIKDAPVEFQNEFEVKYKRIQLIKNKLLDSSSLLENLLKSLFSQYLNPRKLIDVEIQLETLLNAINIDLQNESKNFDIILNDMAYRQKLLDKLATQNFVDIKQYDKAKYIVFKLLKESKNKINQEFNIDKKKLILS